MGGPCDFIVTLVPIGLGFLFRTSLGLRLGLGFGGLDLGLGLDKKPSPSPKFELSPESIIPKIQKRWERHIWTEASLFNSMGHPPQMEKKKVE